MNKKMLITEMETTWGYEVEKETIERVKKNYQQAKAEYTEYRFWGVERETGHRTLNLVVVDKEDNILCVASDEAIAYGWMEELFAN